MGAAPALRTSGALKKRLDRPTRSRLRTVALQQICERDRRQREPGCYAATPLGFEPFDDRPHRLVRDAQVASDGPQPCALDPGGDLLPPLPSDERSFGRHCITANPRSTSCVEQSLGIQEGDQGQSDNIYLAEVIPVEPAISTLTALSVRSDSPAWTPVDYRFW
jgi:hypothetical protein